MLIEHGVAKGRTQHHLETYDNPVTSTPKAFRPQPVIHYGLLVDPLLAQRRIDDEPRTNLDRLLANVLFNRRPSSTHCFTPISRTIVKSK